MAHLLTVALIASLTASFVAGGLVARADDRACTLCLETAQQITQCRGMFDTPPALDCLCAPGVTETFHHCNGPCKNTPSLLPSSLCNKPVVAPELGNEGIDSQGLAILRSTQARVTRQTPPSSEDMKACALCWEFAQAQAHNPSCDNLPTDADISECLCKPGNVANFENCNGACANIPDKLPTTVCSHLHQSPLTADAVSTATDTLRTTTYGSRVSTSTSGGYVSTSTTSCSETHVPHNTEHLVARNLEAIHTTRRSAGGYMGPCGVPGSACGFANPNEPNELGTLVPDYNSFSMPTLTPVTTVTFSDGSGLVTRTAYAAETTLFAVSVEEAV